MAKEKLGVFVVVCTNGDKNIVSCDGYKNLEEAQRAMAESWENEREDMKQSGGDDLSIDAEFGLFSASLFASEQNNYEWVIREV